MPKAERGYPTGHMTIYDTTLGWRYPNPRLEALFPLEQMGETAENIYELSLQGGVTGGPITREAQDAFAVESQRRTVETMRSGRFDEEIVPVQIPQRKGPAVVVDTDEHPRYRRNAAGEIELDTSLEQLAKLGPIFRKGGTVTAGNSSGINDGSAALLITSAEKARELGLKPLARIVTSAAAGVDPRTMGLGPIPATRKALARAGLTIEDIGLIEINEAFAVQALACMRELGLRHEITNVNGGAIALGHPLGCSGARLLTTLVHEMKRRNAAGEAVRYGLVTLCVGVGQGEATIVEWVGVEYQVRCTPADNRECRLCTAEPAFSIIDGRATHLRGIPSRQQPLRKMPATRQATAAHVAGDFLNVVFDAVLRNAPCAAGPGEGAVGHAGIAVHRQAGASHIHEQPATPQADKGYVDVAEGQHLEVLCADQPVDRCIGQLRMDRIVNVARVSMHRKQIMARKQAGAVAKRHAPDKVDIGRSKLFEDPLPQAGKALDVLAGGAPSFFDSSSIKSVLPCRQMAPPLLPLGSSRHSSRMRAMTSKGLGPAQTRSPAQIIRSYGPWRTLSARTASSATALPWMSEKSKTRIVFALAESGEQWTVSSNQ